MEPDILKNMQLQSRLQYALQQLRWEGARLGIFGKTGLGLLVIAIVVLIAAVLPNKSTVQTLKVRAESLQTRSQSPVTSQGAARPAQKIGDTQALQVFYEFFPQIDSSPFWIREIARIAQQKQVEINSSDFRLVQEKGHRLTRYEMILPVRGRYSQMRAFIAEVLEAVPAMAITGIDIKRDNITTEQLEVRLEINLYLDG